MKLIDADMLIEDLESADFCKCSQYDEPALFCSSVIEIINESRTVEAEPVRHGKWEMLTPRLARCSVCEGVESTHGSDRTMRGHIFKAIKRYCPSCGARMDGRKDKRL